MSPYEAYLAGGAFAFKVEADQSKWQKGSDPFKVMWAQSTRPDNSSIWMTFETDTQYPGEGFIPFRVFFQRGKAVEITPVGRGAVTPLNAKIPDRSASASQGPAAAPAPEVTGNLRDMFSWIDGITQEKKNYCLTANREPSKSLMPGTTQVRLQSAGFGVFLIVQANFTTSGWKPRFPAMFQVFV